MCFPRMMPIAAGLATLMVLCTSDALASEEPCDNTARKDERVSDLTWGEERDGLQAAIGRRRERSGDDIDDKHVTQLVIKLRNAGKAPIAVKFSSATFESFPPTVLDAKGKRLRVYMPPANLRYKSRRIEETLQPGDELEIGAEETAMNANGESVPIHAPRIHLADVATMPDQPTVDHPTVYAADGEYRVRYDGFIQSHTDLSTGELAISKPAKEPTDAEKHRK